MTDNRCSPDSTELLPCPFCGGRANVYKNEVDFVTKWSIGCGDCNCDMDVCEDAPADAAVAWNTRPAVAATPSINETETILDAINDYSPRARQTVDLILYKFDIRLRQ